MSPQVIFKIIEYAGKLFEILGKIKDALMAIFDQWNAIDTSAHKTARELGFTKEQAEQLRKTYIKSQAELGALYNLSFEEMENAQKNYTRNTGKALQLTSDQMELFAMTSKSVGEEALNEMVASIDELGGSYDLASSYAQTAYNNAKKFGLNAQKSSVNFAKNFKAVNKLRFREGISDLMKMTMLSDKFKVNFEEVAKSIDNFDTIEDAISNASKIQMLGGNMAYQFGNPLAAMADAQTDAAGFMDRMIEGVKGMAKWDASAGVAKIDNWVDQMKIKEYASALGMSAEELTKIATQGKKFEEVERSIGKDNKDRLAQAGLLDAVENLAQFKDGEWKIQTGDGTLQGIDEIMSHSDNEIRQILSNVATDDIDTNVKDISQNVKAIAQRFGASQQNLYSGKERWDGGKKQLQAMTLEAIDPAMEATMNATSNVIKNTANSNWVNSVTDWLGEWMGYSKVEGAMPQGYNDGGIIGGHQEQGDKIIAGVNSKEMVLTQGQQKNLYDQIQSNPNFPKFSDGGIVGSQEQQDLFKYANRETTPQQNYIKGQRKEIQGNLLKYIGVLSTGIGIEKTRKAEEAAQYANTKIKTYGGDKTIRVKLDSDGFKSKKQFNSSLSETKKALWRGDIKGAKITNADGTIRALKSENAIPKTLNEKFSKTLIDFNKRQKELVEDFKKTSQTYKNATQRLSSFNDKLNNFKTKRIDPIVNFGKRTRNFIAKPFVAAKNLMLKPFQKLAQSSVGTLAKGTLKNVGNLASKLNPISAGKTVLKHAKGAVSSVVNRVGTTVSNSTVGKYASKIGGKLGGKVLGKALKKVPVIGSLITAGGAVMEAMGASDKFNAEKEWINSRKDLTDADKKKMIRKSEDKRNETYGKATGSAIGTVLGGALGTLIPIPGMGLVGSMAGGWLGSKVGGFIGKHWNNTKDLLFGSKNEEKITNNENTQETNNEIQQTKSYSVNGQSNTLLYEKTNDIYKLLVKNFDNNHLYNTQISAVPIVGDRTYISPINDYQNNNSTVNGNINLNINGTLKLDVPTTNQSINIDLESLMKTREFQDKILDIIRSEMSSFGGLRNRENPSYRGCGGTSYVTNYLG